ncbi:hypothetical protein [Methanobrevibacter sp.]|uniref:hypothetical protein n=1 Tax=Methanobrevibacter sp. TaxID=66852 RepID=UPI003D7E6D02
MNYKKLVLVGCISAFVAILTSVMGVAGTIIGSVISSVLYNMLTEVLENPIGKKTFSPNFEWEIAYVFPLIVIGLIQFMLIAALLSEVGILPYTFLNVYLSIQEIANYNLYRILGLALLVMSVYPFVLKRGIVKKSNGLVIAFVGLVFLARGFVDSGNMITNMYDVVFMYFDLPIAIMAFALIVCVVVNILSSSKNHENGVNVVNHKNNRENFSTQNVRKVHHSKKHNDFDYVEKRDKLRQNYRNDFKRNDYVDHEVKFKKIVKQKSDDDKLSNQEVSINKSSDNIQFQSNDLLDDYK